MAAIISGPLPVKFILLIGIPLLVELNNPNVIAVIGRDDNGFDTIHRRHLLAFVNDFKLVEARILHIAEDFFYNLLCYCSGRAHPTAKQLTALEEASKILDFLNTCPQLSFGTTQRLNRTIHKILFFAKLENLQRVMQLCRYGMKVYQLHVSALTQR